MNRSPWYKPILMALLPALIPILLALLSNLSTWPSEHLMILGSSVVAGGVAFGIAGLWHNVQITRMNATLQQEMLQRGLSVEEIERLLLWEVLTETEAMLEHNAIEEVAIALGEIGASSEGTEEAMAYVRATEPKGRAAITKAIQGLMKGARSLDLDVTEEQICAMVRGASSGHASPKSKDVSTIHETPQPASAA